MSEKISSQEALKLARIVIGLSLWFSASWILNTTLYASFNSILPEARDIATVSGAVAALVAAFVAVHRPDVFRERIVTGLSLGFFVSGVALAAFGVYANSVILVVVGSVVRACSAIWFSVILGLSISTLTPRKAVVVIASACVLRYLWLSFSLSVPFEAGLIFYAAIPFFVVGLVRTYALPSFGEIMQAAPKAVQQVTSPQSFIPFTHILFITMIVFGAAYGFAVALGSEGGLPPDSLLSFVPVLIIALFVIFSRKCSGDVLFGVIALLIVASFFFIGETPFVPETSSTPWANVLLNSGSTCFSLLIWFVLTQIVRKNVIEALPVFFFYSAAIHLGTEVGASLGHFINSLAGSNQELVSWVKLITALLFIAYVIIVLKPFSFDATIKQTIPVTKPLVRSDASTLEENCEKVSVAFALTPRETEIMGLLARGRNAQAIQDKLVLSRNTIKTHVKNIYVKLDVHSQQELIDLVESY